MGNRENTHPRPSLNKPRTHDGAVCHPRPDSGTISGRYFPVLLETDLRVFFGFEGCPQGNVLRNTSCNH
jgi:hypothetical protein